MNLQVKSNGKKISMKKADFDKFSSDQKRSYLILNADDAEELKDQVSNNKVVKNIPETGEKKKK